MRKSLMLTTVTMMLVGGITFAQGQTIATISAQKVESQTSLKRVVGEVTAIDQVRSQLTVKTTAGEVTLQLDAKTLYRRVQPGDTNLDKASTISLTDISAGDKVLARGPLGESLVLVRELIVVAHKDVLEKRRHDREDWIKRGVTGLVTVIDPEKKEITVRAHLPEGERQIIISAGEKVAFRRYSAQSIRYSDSQASSFPDLKVGDQLRALADRSADGTHFIAAEIIFGTFRTVVGKIISINAPSGEVSINNVQTNAALTIVVNKESRLHRLSPEVGQLLVQRILRGPAADPSEGSVNLQKMIENLAPVTIAEFKPGDAILVSTAIGADPARATAILFTVGADELVKLMAQPSGRRKLNLELGLPSGVDP